MQFFQELGALIEARWRDANYQDDAFPDIAAAALVEAAAPRHVDPWAIIRWLHTTPQLPAQQDVRGEFGNPPITLFTGDRFYIDIYFWLDGTTTIHQHGFCGAFQVLLGSSIHSQYHFAQERELNCHFLIGQLQLEQVRLLRRGDVQRILFGRPYIHSLFHLDRPSATLTVRNYFNHGEPQYNYLKPHFAVDPFFRLQSTTKKLQSLALLLGMQHPEADQMIGELLSQSDFQTTFAILDAIAGHYTNNALEQTFGLATGALQNGRGDGDIFVVKLNPTGTALVYSALFGGSDSDRANSLAVDAAGNVYVTGATASSDFPVTAGAPQTTWRNGDAFIAKLNPTGTALSYATYLGGNSNEISNGIAVDNAGNAYVTGLTAGTDFPTTPGALRTMAGGAVDAFIAKLNTAGTAFSYATYLGGGGSEIGYGIAVDNAGNAYVTGASSSTNFPTTPNAYQGQLGAGTLPGDAFVAKLNAEGAALVYATLLGGNGVEAAYNIALDAAGNAYIAGETTTFGAANNFPATANAWQKVFGGGNPATDGFVAKLNTTGTALGYATYLGGNGSDRATSLAVDAAGNAFVVGFTGSTNLAATSGALGYTGGLDAFVAQLDVAGAALSYFTYFGGGNNDQGSSIALDAAGNPHVVGNTASASFPVTPGAFQPNIGGSQDAFVFQLNGAGTTGLKTIANVSAASYSGATLAREAIIAAFGSQLATQTASATDADPNTPGIQLPTTLAGARVLVKDNLGVARAAPLFFVSPGQINYQMPPGMATGAALVTVTSGDSAVALGTTPIATVAPGLFTASSTGQGAASGYALRMKADGTQNIEPIAQLDAQNRWITRPIDLGQPTDQVFLVLFGTGWRLRRDLAQVSVKIGEAEARVDFAGAQGDFIGLDQINLLVPRALAGRGRVDVALTVEGKAANNVMVEIK